MLNRRDVIKQSAAVVLGGAVVAKAAHAEAPDWHTGVIRFLESLARDDGGFAWPDQDVSHLSATYAAIGCHHRLGEPVPDRARRARFVREHHPTRWKKLEQEHREFDLQQIQSLLWLGESADEFKEVVRGWKAPVPYLPQYEKHRHPVFRFQTTAFTARRLLGLPLDDLSPAFVDYLRARRRDNGSFNNTPAEEGGDGHVLNTLWGLESLTCLGRVDERRAETVEWLRACQRPAGGFTWQPRPEFAGVEDVAYTWGAVRALDLLGSRPADVAATIRSLHALRSEDGGFGDRPGWSSNATATYYALDALRTLGALERPIEAPATRVAIPAVPLSDDLKVFSCQLEAHGRGSPADAVELARSLGIDLWGAKNAAPGWLARARQIAEERRVPVTFFAANEEYGTWVDVPGFGTYSHTSDIFAPAAAEIGEPLSNAGPVSWPEFRERRLGPLARGGGGLVWQFGENEELVRLFLDDSIERGGYAAISTFHFGNPDFTNSEPFLNRYRGRIPFVALQDAHGTEPWWFADMTTGFRTLFLAREATWDGWLEALRNNRVAAVRRDELTGHRLTMHAGSEAVRRFVLDREAEWRWWDNSRRHRPPASLAVLRPEDRFEAGRPEAGINLRLRCAWTNTPHGLLVDPLAEFVELTLDGRPVAPEYVRERAAKGARFVDSYHLWKMPTPESGDHVAAATVKDLRTGARSMITTAFRG